MHFTQYAHLQTKFRKILLPLNKTQLAKYTFADLGMIAKRKSRAVEDRKVPAPCLPRHSCSQPHVVNDFRRLEIAPVSG
jgi:hypothetical protein